MPDYKYKVRVRACGLLVENDRILLVELFSPVTEKIVWTPPGGGVEFGENLQDTVIREFFEETGLKVKVDTLIHVNELIQNNFHAIEFYFRVQKVSGKLTIGTDPEYPKEKQILKSVAFKTKEEILLLDVAPQFIKKEFWEIIDIEK